MGSKLETWRRSVNLSRCRQMSVKSWSEGEDQGFRSLLKRQNPAALSFYTRLIDLTVA
ncbi:hypothetical protein SAMN05216605_102505 [Pseudomonas abietaniphila]|uniref:Uncharacterized protein n=1 Tax=Pseudomonas abietaniphila TaxID=89065 RepID=A0A1G7VHC6_9PSED|nr:hypothetical protein SAMN05216605_102505 [Pseudomonas abietaniphila]